MISTSTITKNELQVALNIMSADTAMNRPDYAIADDVFAIARDMRKHGHPSHTGAPLPNPIDSIAAWMVGVGHGADELTLYEAMCIGEAAEGMVEYDTVYRHSLNVVHNDHKELAKQMKLASKTIKEELIVLPSTDNSSLLDAHLDSAWVNLCAAVALLGGGEDGVRKLGIAWGRLHRANIVDKQVDGAFVLDPVTRKVQKPAGWIAPDYSDLFDDADSEGGII